MEPIFHLLMPPLLLMAIFPKLNKKLILALLPLTFIMDFDIFIPGMHRFLFHNVFFAAIVTIIIYLSLGKIPGLVSLYYLVSHLIFDIGKWGYALFYPFYDKFIYLETKILGDGFFDFNFAIKTIEITKQQVIEAQHYYFTELGFMVLFLFVVLLIARKIKYKEKTFEH